MNPIRRKEAIGCNYFSRNLRPRTDYLQPLAWIEFQNGGWSQSCAKEGSYNCDGRRGFHDSPRLSLQVRQRLPTVRGKKQRLRLFDLIIFYLG
jgi:hypothetical protein